MEKQIIKRLTLRYTSKSTAIWTRPLRRFSALFCILLFILFSSVISTPVFPKNYESEPLPFNGKLKRLIFDTFYNSSTGQISREKISSFQEQVKQRYKEVKCNFKNYYVDNQGQTVEKAKKRFKQKTEIKVYKILLDYLDTFNRLADEVERTGSKESQTAFRKLALRILELEYALKIEGKKLPSTLLIEKIQAILRNWKIPIHKVKEGEAANLYNPETGKFYSQAQLKVFKKKGGDVSALNPPPDSTFWTPHDISHLDVRKHYQEGGSAMFDGLDVVFPEKKAHYKKVKKTQTKPKMNVCMVHNGKRLEYKLKIGRETHSEITCSALYSALGFATDISKHVKNFKVILGKTTPLEFKQEWESYYSRFPLGKYVKEQGKDEDGHFLIFHEGLLEYKPESLLRAGPWSYGNNGHRGLREVRGSIIFNMWVANVDLKIAENNKLILKKAGNDYRFFHIQHDMGFSFGYRHDERPGSFKWDIVKKKTKDHVHLVYRCVIKNHNFDHVTYADARWMVRLIARLSREQIRDAVSLGGWPDPIAKLLVEKLISRRNQLVAAFGLEGEQNPDGGTFGMLPCKYCLTTPGFEIDRGKLKKYTYDGSPQYFGPRLNEIIMLLMQGLRNMAVDTIVGLTGNIKHIELEPETFCLDRHIVTKIILRIGRQIEPNPTPRNERESYLVKDFVEVGLRLGLGLVVTGEMAFVKKYTLVYPVSTRDQGRFNNKFILHAMLPFRTGHQYMPKNYVLITENYLDGAGRLDFLDKKIPLRTIFVASKIFLQRHFISRKENDRIVFFDDKSLYDELSLRISMQLAHIFRFPFYNVHLQKGKLERELFEMDISDLEFNPKKKEAMQQLLVDGNYQPMIKLGKKRLIEDRFYERKRLASFFGFLMNRTVFRVDKVTETELLRMGEDIETGVLTEWPEEKEWSAENHYYQVESRKLNSWNFMDNGERHFSRIRLMGRTNGKKRIDNPLLNISLQINDMSTSDGELKDHYIRFINRLARDNRFIDFDPTLHTVNGLWGSMQVFVNMTVYKEGIAKLIEAKEEDIWRELAAVTGKTVAYWKRKAKKNYYRGIPRNDRYSRERYMAIKTSYFIKALQDARKTKNGYKRMRLVVLAVSKAIYENSQTYSPVHLLVINKLVGKDNIYMNALVTMPVNKEMVLPTRTPLYNEMGKDRGIRPREFQFIFDDPAEIYNLF